MLTNTPNSYGLISKALHWLMALAIIIMIIVGLSMGSVDKSDPLRGDLYLLHKSTGVVLLLLLVFRLLWLFVISPAPKAPAELAPFERKLSTAIKHSLYLLMLLVPVSGYCMSSFGGHAINVYGWFELPMLFEKNKALGGFFHEVHEIAGIALIPLIILHVAGAIKHRIKDKNGPTDVLKRML